MAVNLDMSVDNDAPNYQNVKITTRKSSPSPATDARHTGAFRLAGVCVGLMCIVQATLNIVLRLIFTCPVAVEMLPSSCYNHTYTVQLQSKYDELAMEKQLLNSNNKVLQILRNQLQAESEKLQTKISNIAEELKRPGWFSFRSSLYYMSSEEKNWMQSREDCRRRGADLVIIKSREEQDFVELLRRGKNAWIGLSDQTKEGVWKWVDGSVLITTFWLSLEPNNYLGSEHCVETGYTPEDERVIIDVLNTWNDRNCADTAHWVCEKVFSV